MRVLMTGATGRLAQHILARPAAAAISWRLLSRRPGSAAGSWVAGDLVTGIGLPEALDGVDAVLHLASDSAHPEHDVRSAEQLARAARLAGIKHLLFLSIIGVDRIPYAYYEAKRAAERVIEDSGVPSTVLRAAQFHSFIDWLLLHRASRVPGLVLVPAGFQVQCVADEDMAAHLLEALRAGPVGRARDFAGPEVLHAMEVGRLWRRARRLRRVVLPVPLRGAVARAFRAGANTSRQAARGSETWAQWLSRRYAVPPNESLKQPARGPNPSR